MRKTLFAGIAIISVLSYVLTSSKDDYEPFEKVLAREIKFATLYTHHDTNFNTAIRVPSFFVQEADTSDIAYSYARYAFYPPKPFMDAAGQIVIEYSASICRDKRNRPCKIDSTTQDNGYRIYSKSIRWQKMKFTYRLTYPSVYEKSVSRLKKEVREWKAFCPNRPKIRYAKSSHKKRAKSYHSGYATE